jgi:hypothetical protein
MFLGGPALCQTRVDVRLESYQKTRVCLLFDAIDTGVGINGPEAELALLESP